MLRRFGLSVGGRLIAASIQTIVLALLARGLGVAQFGSFLAFTSAAQLALIPFDLGFGTRVLTMSSNPERGRIVGSLICTRVAGAIAVALVASIYVDASDKTPLLYVVSAVYVLGELAGDSAVAVYQGELRSHHAMVILLLRRMSALIPFAVGISTETASASLAVAGVSGFLIFVATVSRRARRPLPLRKLINLNLPLTMVSVSTSITQGDTALVRHIAGAQTAGLYGAATRLSNPLNLLISSLLQVLVPTLYLGAEDDKRTAFRRSRRFVLVLAALLCVGSVCAPFIVEIIYGSSYSGSNVVLRDVFIGAALSAVSQIHLAWLYAAGVNARFAVALLVSTVLGLAVIGGLTALNGLSGAGLGIVIEQALILVVVYGGWRKSFRTPL